MYKSLEKLYKDKKILEHGLEVGKELAYVLSGGETNLNKEFIRRLSFFFRIECFYEINQLQKNTRTY